MGVVKLGVIATRVVALGVVVQGGVPLAVATLGGSSGYSISSIIVPKAPVRLSKGLSGYSLLRCVYISTMDYLRLAHIFVLKFVKCGHC